jgi:ABC-type Mn2+/Zn2+ transport system permease subunit
LIYNADSRTLLEQFTMPIQISLIGYGLAVFVIFIIALIGTLINRRRRKTESFFGFLYFLFFSVVIIITYFLTFYNDIF